MAPEKPKNDPHMLKIPKIFDLYDQSLRLKFLYCGSTIYLIRTFLRFSLSAMIKESKNCTGMWIEAFGQYRKLKNSIHWTLGHVIELITKNYGYSLAENSLEATIKTYRYITNNLSRHSPFADNCCDCLKALNICFFAKYPKIQSMRKSRFSFKG